MKLKLEFSMENGAFFSEDGDFEPDQEVARILAEVREQVLRGYNDGDIRDVNGNRIGIWRYCE